MPGGHRVALLDAAKRLLREQGYTSTTARDLVAASGANLGSIGYHFGSKEALLNEALGELFIEWTARITDASRAEPGAGPLDQAAASFVAMLDTMPESRPVLQAFVDALGPATRSPELRAQLATHYRECRRRVAEVVAEALGPAAVAAGADPQVIASYFIAIADGLVLQFLLDPETCPSGEQLVGALGSALAAAAGA